jgi:hypothetical protein
MFCDKLKTKIVLRREGPNMKKTIWIILTLLIVVTLTAGCSGGDSEGASATVQPGNAQSPEAKSSDSQQASGSGESQSQQIKPEQLISKDDAAMLIGESVKAGVSEEYPLLGLSSNFYAPEKEDSKSYLQVCLIQQSALKQGGGGEQSGGSDQSSQKESQSSSEQSGQSESGGGSGGSGGEEMTPKSLYEGLKKLFSDPNAAITGRIGDDIFISAQGISVLSGEYCIIILIGNSDPAKTQEMLKKAGEMAVSNLKRIQGQ